MNEIEILIDHFSKHVTLTEDEKRILSEHFHYEFVAKRQLIIQPNFTPTHRYYVAKGAFRAYLICKEGQDHTIQFAVDDWWITDFNNYIHQEPASLFVSALEDSHVLKISYTAEEQLKAMNHKFETFFRIMAERAVAGMQRRIISNLTQTAEIRYERFLESYPAFAERMPQYAVASYLGMTTEYLSRLRRKRVSQKKLN